MAFAIVAFIVTFVYAIVVASERVSSAHTESADAASARHGAGRLSRERPSRPLARPFELGPNSVKILHDVRCLFARCSP